jgi:alpha-tubulin suppressor-like RCC1 family protein
MQVSTVYFLAAIDENGDLYQWGTGFFDRSSAIESAGSSTDASFSPVCTLAGQKLVSVSCNKDFVFALNESGHLFQIPSKKQEFSINYTGNSAYSRLLTAILGKPSSPPHPCILQTAESFKKVQVGENHLICLTRDGQIVTGSLNDMGNYFGQLGVGQRDSRYFNPIGTISNAEKANFNELEELSKKLPDSVRKIRPSPSSVYPKAELAKLPLSAFHGEKAIDIACGCNHSLVLSESGRVYSFGSNEYLVEYS